jgi:hypothetical protein
MVANGLQQATCLYVVFQPFVFFPVLLSTFQLDAIGLLVGLVAAISAW